MTWTWVEPFAGAAACALRLVGGAGLSPPVAWMGGKRRLAGAILGAMGVPEGRPARVLLADAGPWGWVWPLLLEASSAAAVARVLRSWSGEHPRDLWQRLAAQPPAEDLHERAAQWLWLQARSASGVPIWWDGWRHVTAYGRAAHDRGEDLRWPGHRAQRAEWLASDGRGVERPAGARAVGGRWEKGNEGRVQDASNGQRGHEPGWRMCKTEGREAEQGQARGRTGGMVFPGTIADRVEAIARAFAGVDWLVHEADARTLRPPRRRSRWPAGGVFAYLDPPYVGATGYGWDLARDKVLALARRWADAGAVVAVSEAEPLELAGWHHVELTLPGGKPEWLTLSRAPARLPERQLALFEGRP